MPSNKKRLYIALYPSGVVNNEERKYHWGFLIGPKSEGRDVIPGTRYHVKNSPLGWTYEELELVNVRNTNNLLARILIALLRRLPVAQGDTNWRCHNWIASGLAQIAEDGKCVGTAELDWQKIEPVARRYVGAKTAGGRYRTAEDLLKPKPTWDMLENKESVA